MDNIFFSRIFRNPLDFSLLRSREGGTCSCGTGAIVDAGVGTISAIGGVAARDFDESQQELARL